MTKPTSEPSAGERVERDALQGCAHAPEIPRWIWVEDEDGDFYMSRSISGDWVKYEDHECALRTVREELAAMTEDRDLWRYDHEGDCPVQALLEAERESRKQAEVEAFNAGIEAAADEIDNGEGTWYAEKIRALSKPVQEPAEREEIDDMTDRDGKVW
jgi:hypothetical protein